MGTCKLGEMECSFADILWDRAPRRPRDLVEACAEAFNCKRTTARTALLMKGIQDCWHGGYDGKTKDFLYK